MLGKILPLFFIFSAVSCQDFSECGRTLENHDIKSESNLNEATKGEFPYMCTLFTKMSGFNVFIGGASLISRNQLLTLATAVHTIRNFTLEEAKKAEQDQGDVCEDSHDVRKEIFVSCGDTKLQSNDNPDKQVQRVLKILIHPDYSPRSLIHDMAVLVVEKPFIFSASVGHVCLPNPQQEAKKGVNCTAPGHGRESFQYGSYSRDLRKINLPIWDDTECENKLNAEFFYNTSISNWEIHPSFICAGGMDQADTCEGDGGGPLVCSSMDLKRKGEEEVISDDIFATQKEDVDIFNNDEVDLRTGAENGASKNVQVGVVAWGIKCGQEGMPSVYSSVAHGRCWLDQIMSCYTSQRSETIDSDLDLRTTDETPDSVGKLTEGDCGAWLRTDGSGRAACGCKQVLGKDIKSLELEGNDFDIRNTDSDLDLRTV